jgi:hypothetical protein
MRDEGQDITPGTGDEASFFDDFSFDDLGQPGDELNDDGNEGGKGSVEGEEGGSQGEGSEGNERGDGQDDSDDAGDTGDSNSGDNQDPTADGSDGGGGESDGQSDDDDDLNEFGQMMTNLVQSEVLSLDENNPDYTQDEEGFKKLIDDTVNSKINEAVNAKLSERDERIIELESYLKENDGATVEDFINEQEDFDYGTVDETNPQHAVYLLEDMFKAQGYDDAEIKQTIDEMVKNKSIGRHAKRAKSFLVKEQSKHIESKREAREQRIKQDRDSEAKEQLRFEQSILKTEKVAGIALDPKERQELADYILKPVNEKGQTQMMLDEAGAGDENALLYAYIKKNKVNLAKLEKKSQSKATINFMKAIDKKKKTDNLSKSNKGRRSTDRSAAEGDLTGLDEWNMG